MRHYLISVAVLFSVFGAWGAIGWHIVSAAR